MTMLKTYEAIYEDGSLNWLGEQPEQGRHRVIVTVLEPSPRTQQDPEQVLHDAFGAWGTGPSREAIDAEIDRMRAEWDRPRDGMDEKTGTGTDS